MKETEAWARDADADQEGADGEPVIARENLLSLMGIAVGMGVVSYVSFYFQSFFLIPSLAFLKRCIAWGP